MVFVVSELCEWWETETQNMRFSHQMFPITSATLEANLKVLKGTSHDLRVAHIYIKHANGMRSIRKQVEKLQVVGSSP